MTAGRAGSGEHVIATYSMRVAPGVDVMHRAQDLAAMQSTGTWVALPGETARIRERHAARVVSVDRVPDDQPATRDGREPGDWLVRIAYPAHNIGDQIPLLLATTYGEGASSGPLRLLDLDLPESFTAAFRGPRFGVAGLRSALGVPERPLLVTMMKPALGLSPEESGRIFRELAIGGVDCVKDDELLVAHPWSSIVDRVRAHERASAEVFGATGHRTIYCVNVTDRPDRMLANARRAIDAGATGLMIDFVTVGISAISMLADDPGIAVPILGHLAFAGAIYGSSTSGVSAHLVLGTLPRLAGADLIVYPGPSGTLSFTRPMHMGVAQALTGSFHDIAPTLPVPGGGLHAGMVPQLVADLGKDFAIGAGGAVHGHPQGPAAGARAIRQAIDATLAGEPLAVAAGHQPELASALSAWPGP